MNFSIVKYIIRSYDRSTARILCNSILKRNFSKLRMQFYPEILLKLQLQFIIFRHSDQRIFINLLLVDIS